MPKYRSGPRVRLSKEVRHEIIRFKSKWDMTGADFSALFFPDPNGIRPSASYLPKISNPSYPYDNIGEYALKNILHIIGHYDGTKESVLGRNPNGLCVQTDKPHYPNIVHVLRPNTGRSPLCGKLKQYQRIAIDWDRVTCPECLSRRPKETLPEIIETAKTETAKTELKEETLDSEIETIQFILELLEEKDQTPQIRMLTYICDYFNFKTYKKK